MENELVIITDDNYILTEVKKNKELYFWNFNFDKITDMDIAYLFYQKYVFRKIIDGACPAFNDIIFERKFDSHLIKIKMYSFKKTLKK